MFFSLLETLATHIDSLSNKISNAWYRLSKGPLQTLAFYIVCTLTFLYICVEALCEELDDFLDILEKSIISIAMLAMVALSFLDYARREIPFVSMEIHGGANMAVVLMVWVGFLGASLATRQKEHLAVDATDRILSPKAAQLTKRFTALVAGIFCWKFAGHAQGMIEDSLRANAGQDALPLWDIFVAPVDMLGTLLFNSNNSLYMALSCSLVLGLLIVAKRTHMFVAPILTNTLGSVCLFIGGLSWLGYMWNPVQNDGTIYQYTELGVASAEPSVQSPTEMDSLQALIAEDTGDKPAPAKTLQELQNLIAEDTGETEEAQPTETAPNTETTNDADLAAFVANNTGGHKFPLWLAQSVIPLSFFLMALRFLALAVSARFTANKEESAENTPIPSQAVATENAEEESTTPKNSSKGARDLIFAGLFPGILIGVFAVWGGSIGWLILFSSIVLVLVGAPLFLVIGLASLACVTIIQDISAFNIAKDMYEAVKKEELLAIPFFVLAGNLMTKGSIAQRLVGVARAAMGNTPGGLGLASITACVIFAAISGSSPVTVIAVGSIMYPMLVAEKYPDNYSLGVVTSAGSLGIIIPPSVPMIIYAIMVSQTLTSVGKEYIDPSSNLLPGGWGTEVLQLSPNKLFVAGILPGLFIAAMMALYTVYQIRPTRQDIQVKTPVIEGGYWNNLGREIRKSLLSILLPVLILGGIYGILGPLKFTVTEAAAVSVVYALIIELFVHKELRWKDVPNVLSKSGVMMGSLFLIIVLAIAFNKFLAEQYIPQNAAAWIQAHVQNKWQFLILVNIFLLGLGCVMDIISAILIVAPLLAPIALSYGIHPLHFGIMFIVNLELGYLTPPLGINLFVASTVFKRPVIDVMKGSVPFLLLMIFCLAVIVFVPFLSLGLI